MRLTDVELGTLQNGICPECHSTQVSFSYEHIYCSSCGTNFVSADGEWYFAE